MLARIVSLAAYAALVFVHTAHAADPAVSCESGKLKTAGKYASCLLSADSKAAKTGVPADYSTCISKFGTSWQKAEDNGEGMCPGGDGDQTDVQTLLDVCTESVAHALAGSSDTLPVPGGVGRTFTDNGDGTIHDVLNTYTWSDAAAVKVATLNSTSFGGHNDWRVPDRFELETLVNTATYSPATYPAFISGCTLGCTIATCNCTTSLIYWSSTTYAFDSTWAWAVSFAGGSVDSSPKDGRFGVRAVRGGS